MASTQNGPVSMYKTKSYYGTRVQTELPNCMYKVKPYHEEKLSTHKMKGQDNVEGVLAQLEKRQEAILARLQQLKAEVEKMRESSPPTVASETATALKSTAAPPKPAAAIAMTSTPAAQTQEEPVNGILRDLVINVNPNSAPLSLLVLYNLLSQQYKVLPACHVHSSVSGGVSEKQRSLFGLIDRDRRGYQFAFTLVWKDVKYGASLMVNPGSQLCIEGEGNIARYLARVLTPAYDSGDITTATEIDYYVDLATQLTNGKDKEKASVIRTVNAKLGKSNTWLVGNKLSLADISLWAAMHKANQVVTASGNVKRWLDGCDQVEAFQSALNRL